MVEYPRSSSIYVYMQAEKHKMTKVLTNVTKLRNESQHYKTDCLCMTWIRFIEYIALTWLQSNPWIPKFSNYDALERVYITNFIISIVNEVKLGGKKGILWLLTMYMLLLLLSRFSRVRLCVTPWTAAHQKFLYFSQNGIFSLFTHNLKDNVKAFTAHEIMIRLWLQSKCNALINREWTLQRLGQKSSFEWNFLQPQNSQYTTTPAA